MDWFKVDPVPHAMSSRVESALRQIDSLHQTWKSATASDAEGIEKSRLRTLRRHAIETGILERLYDLDWGMTEALVADGIVLEVAERQGNVDANTLETISSQLDALEMVVEFARNERQLSSHFIRDLHVQITRSQETFIGKDSLGRVVETKLHHGAWKNLSNGILREDGTQLSFCPPEFVQDEMDLLIRHFNESEGTHPLVRAAWLHHRFISIHPFEDGNGRVARALVLLVLLAGKFPPIVVDRRKRKDYLHALEQANLGNLDDLVLFLGDLLKSALLTQFEEPFTEPAVGVKNIVRDLSELVKNSMQKEVSSRASEFSVLAEQIQAGAVEYLQSLKGMLDARFVDPSIRSSVYLSQGSPNTDTGHYYRHTIAQLATQHNFYANMSGGTWWSALKWKLQGEQMQVIIAITKIGYDETGIGSVLVAAERRVENFSDEHLSASWESLLPDLHEQLPISIGMDAVTTKEELFLMLEKSVSAALTEFVKKVV